MSVVVISKWISSYDAEDVLLKCFFSVLSKSSGLWTDNKGKTSGFCYGLLTITKNRYQLTVHKNTYICIF